MALQKNIELNNHPCIVIITVIAGVVGIISGCVSVFIFLSGNTSIPTMLNIPSPTRLAQNSSDVPSLPATTPTPRISTPPLPTIAFTATAPKFTDTPTNLASALNPGQTWVQDGILLVLTEPIVTLDRIATSFILKNKTNSQIMFNLGLDSFSVRDNLGNNGKILVSNRFVCPTGFCYSIPQETISPDDLWCNPPPGYTGYYAIPAGCPRTTPVPISYLGAGDTTLKAGESLKIDVQFSDLNLIKTQVTEVIVTVKELSRIKDVSWRIAISH
jgi:hypothetical protein